MIVSAGLSSSTSERPHELVSEKADADGLGGSVADPRTRGLALTPHAS
jgi:hypothetical protein